MQRSSFQKGDKVHVQNPVHVMKGHKRHTEPLTIWEKAGNSTYSLSDNKTCNADRDTVQPVMNSPPRSRGVTQKPVCLKDYVL